jgi:Uma2 family endonuclease
MPTATLPVPPAAAPPVGPRPMLWSCPEFHRLGDLGVFEGRRPKLINGAILEEGPMNPPHAIALVLLAEAIRVAFGTGWHLRNQLPLVFGLYLDPMPDLAVIAGSPRGLTGHPTTADLVIEVADTSLHFDTTEKRLLYAAAVIADYWVLDLNSRRLLVYRDPQAGDYATHQVIAATGSVTPLAAPTGTVRVADVLP